MKGKLLNILVIIMVNILISIIYLTISFLITILLFKNFGKYGLYIWMCILVVLSNIQTIKITEIFGLSISLGNISYGAIFLTTDILNEKYGKKATYNAIKMSFISMIIFSLLMSLFLKYEPGKSDFSQDALTTIFSYMPRITFASLIAYVMSQLCDANIYNYLKVKYNKVWISNNVSTIISQMIDTVIFSFVSFVGIISLKEIITLIFTMISVKWIIALLDTPFILLAIRIRKIKELD